MASQLDRQYLKKQLKILQPDFNKWNKQQFSRLLALLKFSEPVQKQFIESCGQQVNAKSIAALIQKLQSNVNEQNYFPFHKLKCALNLLINSSEQDYSQTSIFNKNLSEFSSQINVPEKVVTSLAEAVDKLPDISIIQLNTNQVYNIIKNSGLDHYANVIKRGNIDGFNLVFSMSQWEVLKDIRNYFKDEDIKIIIQSSYLFIIQHFRQMVSEKQRKLLPFIKKSKTDLQVTSSFRKKSPRQLSPRQLTIQSQQLSKKYSQDQIQVDQTIQPQYGESVLGNSEMGQSELGTSVRESVYPESQYPQSQFAASVRGSVDCRMSFRVGDNDHRASLMYNSQILKGLRQVSLKLPFDLLNLQPLQQIKIRSLKSPFSKQIDKNSWIFYVQGAKLGRDKQNDIRFPDQLSISSRHAQIVFKNQGFYLQDLGSKTGTYLRILTTIPVGDELRVQLSTDVQIYFRALKNLPNEGVIKAQIKKPQNLPDYKITLKQGQRVIIGKSQRCNIIINNNSLAQRHAQILYKNSTLFFKNRHVSWIRLSAKSVPSELFKLNVGDIIRLSSKKGFQIESIVNGLQKKQQSVILVNSQ